jgi:uncharacterized protein (TIGR00730 family)
MKITVFCASGSNAKKEYYETAEKLGQMLARRNHEIIFGGGNNGMMNSLADGAISEGGRITGVIPEFMFELELAHSGISQILHVEDMHKRESYMLIEADLIIVLPGGCGTFSELMQAISWKYLGLIIAPIIIVNLNNYFDPLLEMLQRAIEEGFMKHESSVIWKVVGTVEEAVELIIN